MKEHGHCSVTGGVNSDMSLEVWVTTQRSVYTKGSLLPQRIDKLNELSFIWSTPLTYDKITIKLEAQWKATYYGKLMAFKAAHGHCDVPTRWKDDRSLAKWVTLQRRLYNQGELRVDRKELLDQVGFHGLPNECQSHHEIGPAEVVGECGTVAEPPLNQPAGI
jgi:hypothetical protein